MAEETRREKDRDEQKLSSPYGPQYRDTDEAAGGADSSPLETTSPEEREQRGPGNRATNPAAGSESAPPP